MRSKRLTSATDMMRPLQIAYNIRMNKINELPQGYDYRPLPDGLYIGFSTIEGNGLFTRDKLSKEATLGISHIECNNKLIRL